MAYEFKAIRRVEFADTDMAGIMHYSNFFRFMETAEHAFFRSLGLSIVTDKVDAAGGLAAGAGAMRFQSAAAFRGRGGNPSAGQRKKIQVAELRFQIPQTQRQAAGGSGAGRVDRRLRPPSRRRHHGRLQHPAPHRPQNPGRPRPVAQVNLKLKLAAFLAVSIFPMTPARAQHYAAGTGQPADFVRSHYVKHEYRIPMRDGVKLFTSVYAPKDTSRPYPILMVRTPYSVAPYGERQLSAHLGPADSFAREGFIFVYQDVRGRYLSEGEFIDDAPHKTHLNGPTDTDPSTDTYDTIDWLVKNIPEQQRARRHVGRFLSGILSRLTA